MLMYSLTCAYVKYYLKLLFPVSLLEWDVVWKVVYCIKLLLGNHML